MAAHSYKSKYDTIKIFLLGYLYYYITIYVSSVKSLDLDASWEFKNGYTDSLENCTKCNVNLKHEKCVCWENYFSKYIACCSSTSCYDCTPLNSREDRQRLMIMTQISISVLFVFGLIGLILLYCKMCNRRQRIPRTRCIMLQEERETHCSTIEGLRERPPPYDETPYSAPPLYSSPYNRASMQEAPPSYPGTPKLQERSQDNQLSPRHSVFVTSSIAQHM